MHQRKTSANKADVGKIHTVALVLGVVSVMLGIVFILAISWSVVDIVYSRFHPSDHAFADIGAGVLFVFLVPLAAIVAGAIWVAGIVVARVALRREVTTAAKLGLRLSVGSPLLVLICYVAGWGLILLTRPPDGRQNAPVINGPSEVAEERGDTLDVAP